MWGGIPEIWVCMHPPLTSLRLACVAWRRSPASPLLRNQGSCAHGESGRAALERGLIHCQGRTPEATMASALYTDGGPCLPACLLAHTSGGSGTTKPTAASGQPVC